MIYLIQIILIPIISLPLISILDTSIDLSFVHWVGILIELSGILIETIADIQLSKFKSDQNVDEIIVRNKIIKGVISKLDSSAPKNSNLQVIYLKYANAEEIASISMTSLSPSFITEPFPKLLSIWLIVDSNVFNLSINVL